MNEKDKRLEIVIKVTEKEYNGSYSKKTGKPIETGFVMIPLLTAEGDFKYDENTMNVFNDLFQDAIKKIYENIGVFSNSKK